LKTKTRKALQKIKRSFASDSEFQKDAMFYIGGMCLPLSQEE
jgi:hypothetical protein